VPVAEQRLHAEYVLLSSGVAQPFGNRSERLAHILNRRLADASGQRIEEAQRRLLDIDVEKVTLVPMLIDLHMKRLGYTASDMQMTLCIETPDLNDLYDIKPVGPSLRLVT
jgi:hypothetical protein